MIMNGDDTGLQNNIGYVHKYKHKHVKLRYKTTYWPAQSVVGLDKSGESAIQSLSRGVDEGYRSHTRFAD